MASISRNRKTGSKRIVFIGPDRVRRAIYLGKFPQKGAETICRHVEVIVSTLKSRLPLDVETADWLGKISDELYDKLVTAQLVQVRSGTADSDTTLKALHKARDESKLKAKASTRIHWGHTWRNLFEFFGELAEVSTITEADADRWAEWLEVKQGLSLATVHKRCQNAKAFFRFAVKSRMIESNPFAELKSGNISNREKDFFLSREDAQRLIDACPDAEWRLIIALSRYGGLRCPSEHLALKWEDIDFKRGRMRVRSPKTEHHQGKAFRMVPIFPELYPYLDELREQSVVFPYVIVRFRSAKQNLRTQFLRIIKRAGLEPWPKLFHNLRATRQTELEESFPSHVVCSWIGNSERVAQALSAGDRGSLRQGRGARQRAMQRAKCQKCPKCPKCAERRKR